MFTFDSHAQRKFGLPGLLLLSSTFSSLQLNGLILQQVPFLGLARILLFPTPQGRPLFSWI